MLNITIHSNLLNRRWMVNPDMKEYRLGSILKAPIVSTDLMIMVPGRQPIGLFFPAPVAILMETTASGKMYSEKHRPILWPQIPWHEAIDHPGSFQMGILKKLFTSRAFQKLEPSKEIVVDGPASGGAKVKASLANDGSFAIIYSPRGEKFTIDKGQLKDERDLV